MGSVNVDQGIIDRAMHGDKEAFGILVRASGSRSLIVAERILRSPDEAISAARKLFVITYTNLKKLKDLGLLELWLMQTLVRVCGDTLKDATKRGVALPAQCDFPMDLAVAGLLETVSAVDAANKTTLAEARRETVRKAVDYLPFLERTAVIFRDWDGMSYLEVAQILRVKNDDVRKLLVRGRKGVAEMLAPQAQTPADPQPQFQADPRHHQSTPQIAGTGPRAVDKKTAREMARRLAECEKMRDKFWLFVGGEVDQSELMDVRAHLWECPECGDSLRRASIVLEAIRDAAPLEDKPLIAPEMLWQEIEPLLVR
jgi:RNA polymerase sigma-70 factor (ECF subfamily)